MKDKITEQSILLFEKKGFSQTSIQDIVDELEVTKGTFYYYFSSKEQLLMDIHLNYISGLLERQEIILHTDATERQKLIQMIHLLICDIKDKGPSAKVFFREIRHLGDKHMEMIKKQREQFRLHIEKIVQTGMEKGEFRNNLRPDIIAFGILGVTNWSYNWYKPNGEVTIDELVEIYAAMLLTGIEK